MESILINFKQLNILFFLFFDYLNHEEDDSNKALIGRVLNIKQLNLIVKNKNVKSTLNENKMKSKLKKKGKKN